MSRILLNTLAAKGTAALTGVSLTEEESVALNSQLVEYQSVNPTVANIEFMADLAHSLLLALAYHHQVETHAQS